MWQWLVGNWVKQQVQRRVYESVMDAAHEQLRGTAASSQRERGHEPRAAPRQASPAGDDRCDVGLVFAMGGELRGVVDRAMAHLKTSGAGFVFHTGRFAGCRIAMIETGIGREAAQRGAEALIDGHQPRGVVSAGFAGGLQPQVRRHDFVLGTEIIDLNGARLSIDLHVDPHEADRRRDLHIGRLLTVDRVVVEPEAKRGLGQETGALAVDMESAAVAEVCRRRQVRFLAVRIVSDGVEDRLPREIERLARPQSTIRRAGLALGSLTQRPSAAKDYWRLWRDGLEASDRLAQFLEGMLAQLPRSVESEAE